MKKISLTSVIAQFSASHKDLWTRAGARGQSLSASYEFMKLFTDDENEMANMLQSGPRSYLGGPIEEHYWVNVAGKNIDWTIRQYSETMSIPTIWKYPYE